MQPDGSLLHGAGLPPGQPYTTVTHSFKSSIQKRPPTRCETASFSSQSRLLAMTDGVRRTWDSCFSLHGCQVRGWQSLQGSSQGSRGAAAAPTPQIIWPRCQLSRVPPPWQVHLLVDTTLSNDKFSINAFMSRLLTLGDKVLATEFVEMPCEVLFGEAEKVGGEFMKVGAFV